ncbi:MAG TPA: hypothetical protein VK886_12095 [Vicinamibacterales bacterium]|nr:hypothetical protein [Vicinamibacterales bacterium]
MRAPAAVLKGMALAGAIAIVTVTPAPAQETEAGSTRAQNAAARWVVTGGYETFAFRDISRSGRPVDASPIAWEGQGPAVGVTYERQDARRLHRIQVSAARTGGFAYRSPTRLTDAAGGDAASRVDARYEYRRYPLRDLLLDGLDVGIGAQGIAGRVSAVRETSPSLTARFAHSDIGAAGVIGARLRRWNGFELEAAWINGLVISRRQREHSADALSSAASWGGGWLEEIRLTGRVRLSRATALTVGWWRSGEGFGSDHFNYATKRNAIMAGVSYAR